MESRWLRLIILDRRRSIDTGGPQVRGPARVEMDRDYGMSRVASTKKKTAANDAIAPGQRPVLAKAAAASSSPTAVITNTMISETRRSERVS